MQQDNGPYAEQISVQKGRNFAGRIKSRVKIPASDVITLKACALQINMRVTVLPGAEVSSTLEQNVCQYPLLGSNAPFRSNFRALHSDFLGNANIKNNLFDSGFNDYPFSSVYSFGAGLTIN